MDKTGKGNEGQAAQAMVRVPKQEEVVTPRTVMQPDSALMGVSADGVMLHVRDEGWKEVKVASISAVAADETGVRLTHHSTRPGCGRRRSMAVTCGPKPAVAAWNVPSGWSVSVTGRRGSGT